MNWFIRKYRVWKIKRNTTQGMRKMAYLKHIGRIFFIGASFHYFNDTLRSFPALGGRIQIVTLLSAVSGVFIVQTVKYLKATFKRDVL